jgi:hypothetical protein
VQNPDEEGIGNFIIMLFRKFIFLIEVLFILLAISLPVYAEDNSGGGIYYVVGFLVLFIVIVWSSAAKQAARLAAEKAVMIRDTNAKQAARLAAEKARKIIEKAETAYQSYLAQLKADPTNSDLRQKTLEQGRYYSNLARDSKGVTIFDEMALMNDINAVCGGTTNITGATTSASTPITSLSIEERLAKLSNLRAKGLIDEQEYDTRRKKILDEI